MVSVNNFVRTWRSYFVHQLEVQAVRHLNLGILRDFEAFSNIQRRPVHKDALGGMVIVL